MAGVSMAQISQADAAPSASPAQPGSGPRSSWHMGIGDSNIQSPGNSCSPARIFRGNTLLSVSNGAFNATKPAANQLFSVNRSIQALTILAMAMGSGLAPLQPAGAGPVICTTSLEAPIIGTREATGAISVPPSPMEVTRCGIVQTTTELLERRANNWTSPYARGVDLTHQVTDLFGIAMGGGDGSKVMGFGYGDQTLIWDGSAIQNTARVLLQDQSNPMPLRTTDLVGVYTSSLGGSLVPQVPEPNVDGGAYRSATIHRSVRGMW